MPDSVCIGIGIAWPPAPEHSRRCWSPSPQHHPLLFLYTTPPTRPQQVQRSFGGIFGVLATSKLHPTQVLHLQLRLLKNLCKITITHDPNAATNLHVTEAEHILNSKSGWKSITGTTDFGEIVKCAFGSGEEEDVEGEDAPRLTRTTATLAYDIFLDRILNYIGSYHLKLRAQVDALVFAGGIGEKSPELRASVCKELEAVGFPKLDEGKNQHVGEGIVVDLAEIGKKILVCRTDEQLEMARQCAGKDEFWEQ
ncbi:hypothetical protein PQX77_013806 [Marasmius sp. AFHP31]|nr:hypothetical protein PQX77_013806 [Marasmius sp. AFHP31]